MSNIVWGRYPEAYKAIHDAIHGIKTDWDYTITRNGDGFITQIEITDGTITKTITITRDGNNKITAISESVS